ncbi:MAG: LysM peptidoglycan-binding domain-containing protein [Betaproteobacteria bacterium]|nr:LysM peptidoglycan-binding domain-containing protein [Betaproteobacteria bacterium]
MHDQWRKSITTLAFVLAWAVGAPAFAQAPKTPLAMKPDAPDRYVVVPGDTLWGIAQRYTDSPWRWPELWNMNKDQIKNPHRIYPGNVIVLDRARSQLALAGGGTVKLSPRVRAESTAKAAIPSIPPAIIEPFLTRPLVVEPDGLDQAPSIVAAEESRVILENGNRAFVRGIGDSKEATWFVYRRGAPLVDPDNNTTLGYEAIYLGTARVVRAGEPAVIQLTSVTQEIGVGDKLVPAGKAEVPTYAPRAPSSAVQGRVISMYGKIARVGEAGAQTVISINRGKSQGLEVGHVLALYRPGATVADASRPRDTSAGALTLPNERYGLAFVFRVFDRVSYALVMNISRPVNPLDVVQNP